MGFARAVPALLLAGCAGVSPGGEGPATAGAHEIHRAALVFDGHNDLPWQLRERDPDLSELDLREPQPDFHTDIPRLRAGGVGAQFWSAYAPAASERPAAEFLEQIELIHRLIEAYPDVFELALTADDVERIHAEGKIASLIGVEGGHAIEGSLGALRALHRLGARYMTLTHSDTLEWADSATDEERHGGLTPFGEDVVRTMNELGMLVDVSHVSVEAMRDVLRVSRAPVIASHSSAYALAAHPRNVPDEILREVRDNGGVVMINFFSGFVVAEAAQTAIEMFAVFRELQAEHGEGDAFRREMGAWIAEHPMPRGTLSDVVDHVDHVVRIAGIDHVGLGSDFDGVSLLPEGLEDVSTYPAITAELLSRGYDRDEIEKILGANVLRALREAERVAGRGR